MVLKRGLVTYVLSRNRDLAGDLGDEAAGALDHAYLVLELHALVGSTLTFEGIVGFYAATLSQPAIIEIVPVGAIHRLRRVANRRRRGLVLVVAGGRAHVLAQAEEIPRRLPC